MNLGLIIILFSLIYSLSSESKKIIFTRLIILTAIIQLSFPGILFHTSFRDFTFGEVFQLFGFLIIIFLTGNQEFYNKKFIYTYFFFLFCILFGIFILIVLGPPDIPFPGFNESLDDLFFDRASPKLIKFSTDHIIRVVRIIMLFPYLSVLSLNYYDKSEIEKILLLFGKFYFSFILFEFIVKLLSLNIIFDTIYTIILGFRPLSEERGSLPALIGFTLEPSHLGYSLILPLIVYSYKNRTSFLFFLMLLLMLLSGSLRTSSFALWIILLYFSGVVIKFNITTIVVTLILSIFFIIAVSIFIPSDFLDYSYSRYMSVFNPFESEGSSGVRIFTWQYAFDAIRISPLFGIGLGSISIYSGLLATIASVGFVGFYSYIKLVKQFSNIQIKTLSVFGLFILMLFSWNVNILYEVGIYIIFLLIGFKQLYSNKSIIK